MIEYDLISKFYGSRTAKRSGVPLINHINEGLIILDHIGSTDVVKGAYCIHPLFQSDENLIENKGMDLTGVSTESIILTMEYRRVANSYLRFSSISSFVGISLQEIKEMLIADKIQNYKDFYKKSHFNSLEFGQLYNYFHVWFGILGIPEDFANLVQLIDNDL